MRKQTTFKILALCAVVGTAWAADTLNLKTGLWSMSVTSQLGNGQPSTETDQQCITAEDVRNASFASMVEDRDSCKLAPVKQTPTQLVGSVDCKGDGMNSHSEIDFAADTPTTLRGTMKMTVTGPKGPTTMKFTMNGKWLAASCPKED